ncbi:MAG: YdeI/OmpD-associated family protein [Bryobacteraceae bacterium]
MEPRFFARPADWRKWLEQNHAREKEVLVGFYKRETGKPSITWPESVDAALCFGWIDGVRRGIDAESYSIRFTPRRPRSFWSRVNVQRAGELIASGLMHPAGLRAFESREGERSGVYSFEQKEIAFDKDQEREFKKDKAAWQFFQSQAPWYRRAATWWVISAKRDETKAKRLKALIADSAAGRTIGPLTRRDSVSKKKLP